MCLFFSDNIELLASFFRIHPGENTWPGSALLKSEPSSLSANNWLLLPRDGGLLQQENTFQYLGLIRCDDKTSHSADRTDREEQTLGRLIAAKFYCMDDKRSRTSFFIRNVYFSLTWSVIYLILVNMMYLLFWTQFKLMRVEGFNSKKHIFHLWWLTTMI